MYVYIHPPWFLPSSHLFSFFLIGLAHPSLDRTRRHKEAGYRKEGEDARARIQTLTGRRGELKAKMEQLVCIYVGVLVSFGVVYMSYSIYVII